MQAISPHEAPRTPLAVAPAKPAAPVPARRGKSRGAQQAAQATPRPAAIFHLLTGLVTIESSIIMLTGGACILM